MGIIVWSLANQDAMAMTPRIGAIKDLAQLPRKPASDVKKRGWRGLMRTLKMEGKMVVTNHNEPEAVIIAAEEYALLVQIVRQLESKTESDLDTLRRRFDERLAALQAPDATDRLRSVMRGPADLGGQVKAGESY